MPDFRSLFAPAEAQPDFQSMFAPAPSTGQDILSSLPRYAETAVSNTLGLPGDIVKAGRSLGEMVGLGDPSNNAPIEGSEEVRRDLQKSLGYGNLYQPQTTIGKGGDLAASLLPTMVGGPESMLTKLGTRVAVPATVATGAGEAAAQTFGEQARPYAETAALLLSPFASHPVIKNTLTTVKAGLPLTTAQTRASEQALYKVANMTGTKVEKNTFQQFYQAADDHFMHRYNGDEALFRQVDPESFRILKSMKPYADKGIEPPLQIMHDWRRQTGKQLGKSDNAGAFYGEFQNFFNHLDANPGSLVGPDKLTAIKAMRAADEMHSRYKNMSLMDQYMKTADYRSGKNYTQATSATAIRQEFGKLATDMVKAEKSKYARFYTPAQKEQLDKLVMGSKAMNAAKKVAHMAPTSIHSLGQGSMVGGGLALLGVSHPISAAITAGLWGTGAVAKALYPYLTKREARRFIDLVKQGKPVPGTPSYAPARVPLQTPRLAPGLAAGLLGNQFDQQNQ